MSEPLSQSVAGYYLQGLLTALKKVIPERQHHYIECWMEDVEMTIGAKHQGLGMDIGYLSYRAQFTFEKFPFQKIDPAVIMASVMGWLMDNDKHRDDFNLNDPTFDIESESETTVLMNLEIAFIEPLMVVEDAKGLICWQGKKWALAPYEIWVAEHGDVGIASVMTTNDD